MDHQIDFFSRLKIWRRHTKYQKEAGKKEREPYEHVLV